MPGILLNEEGLVDWDLDMRIDTTLNLIDPQKLNYFGSGNLLSPTSGILLNEEGLVDWDLLDDLWIICYVLCSQFSDLLLNRLQMTNSNCSN